MGFEAYLINISVFIGIYAILAISLNLAMGFVGLLNLGHAAFYGLGAYTSAILALNLGLPFWLSLLCAGLVAGFFGFLVSLPTLKLKGDYLAIATLGFAIVIENIFRNWVSLTRGPLGIPGIPKPELFGYTFDGLSFLMLVIFFVLVAYLFVFYITSTPYGKVLKAIREDELAAKTLGKNVIKYKTQALVISAFFAGIAGSLFAHYINFIDPSSFTTLEVILMISMIIVGGLSSVPGSVIGAAIIVLLPEPLRFLHLPSSSIGALRQIIYALVLILILIYKPKGIFSSSEEEKNASRSKSS